MSESGRSNTRGARRRARPEVSRENHAAVYDFFGPGRRRDWFTHPLLRLVGLLYAVDVRIPPAVVAEVQRLHEAGVGMIVAANHPSTHDPFVLAGAVWDARVRFLAAGTGLAKDPLFRGPSRPIFEYTGTVPVFRAKNYPDSPLEQHDAVARRLIELCVRRIADGGVVLTFVEGTNSSADDLRTLRLESVKKGVGQMVGGARARGRPVAVVPTALAYHGREHATLPPRRAVATLGMPILWDEPGPTPSVPQVRGAVRDGIDAALDEAWRSRG